MADVRPSTTLSVASRLASSRDITVLHSVAFSYHSSLHEHALGAASSLLLAVVHIHGLGWAVCACGAAAAGRVALHLAVVSPDFSHDIEKGLVNVDARLGRRLNELAAE